MIQKWRKDETFKTILANSSKLFSASAIATGLSIITTALIARALGAESYGVYGLVLVYHAVIGRLISFNAWQATIKFGIEALQNDDHAKLTKLFRFGLMLDILSAVIGFVIALIGSRYIISWFGWSEEIIPLLQMASLLILSTWSGTVIGVFRLFNRFDILSAFTILNVGLRFIAILFCVWSGQDLLGFVVAYIVSGVLFQLIQNVSAIAALKHRGYSVLFFQPLGSIRADFPQIIDYIWTTNFHSTVRMLTRESDELVIAGLTSPAAYGTFRIAKQFARVLPIIVDPLTQSIYPELARLWSDGDARNFWSVIKRTSSLVAVPVVLLWILFGIFGRWFIELALGNEFLAAFPIAVVYMFALIIAVCTFALHPALLAIGRPKAPFAALIVATLLYFILLATLLPTIGILGAPISYIAFYCSWTLIVSLILYREIKPRFLQQNSSA